VGPHIFRHLDVTEIPRVGFSRIGLKMVKEGRRNPCAPIGQPLVKLPNDLDCPWIRFISIAGHNQRYRRRATDA
jgi:hypothetical protein